MEVRLVFDSCSENERFARMVIAAFVLDMDPTIEELADIKTAVSEAVTNCVIHGYPDTVGKIYMNCLKEEKTITVEIIDEGVGIEDIEKAMEPMYTTIPEERSGMGFSFMEAFMDEVQVESMPERKGTLVRMKKEIGKGRELWTTQSI